MILHASLHLLSLPVTHLRGGRTADVLLTSDDLQVSASLHSKDALKTASYKKRPFARSTPLLDAFGALGPVRVPGCWCPARKCGS